MSKRVYCIASFEAKDGLNEELFKVLQSLEQQTIFQRGATRISSIEFYNMVFDTSEDIKRSSKKVSTSHKSTIQDNIDEDILKKLEAIRRG